MTGVRQAVTCLQVHSRLLLLLIVLTWHDPPYKDLSPLSWRMVLHV